MWCNFEQSPLEDETISNAFSSRGIFKISSDEEVNNYPFVNSSIQNNRIVISIDKSIILLENELVSKCSYLSFNAQVDVIAISSSGNLIVCGLSDGEIHGIYIKGILLFNLCVKLEDVHMTSGKTFACIQQVGNRFHIICTNGSVYCISEIDEISLESNLNTSANGNESMEDDKTVLDNVIIERLNTGRSLSEITSSVLLPRTSILPNVNDMETLQFLFIGGSYNLLYFRSEVDDLSCNNLPKKFGGLKQIFNLDNFILALTNSGHLLEICPYTKTINFSPTKCGETMLIGDMLVMESSDDNIELLILTKATKDQGRLIKILEYPTMKCHSELEVEEHSWLVQQPKCSVNLFYLNGKSLNNANIPTAIEMILVSETHPSERFKKLIAKGHLDEAEDFGKQFEICLQPIYEARAKRLLIELSIMTEKTPKENEKYFDELLVLLKQIESKVFIKNNRMINMPSRQILEKYLNEIKKCLDIYEDEKDVLEIDEQLQRLKTLTIIDPYECNMDWPKFVYHSNLVKMIMTLFKTDIPTACLIWKRHSSSIMPHLNDDELRKILNLIPNKTAAFYLVQWLRQFVSTVSNTHPNIMPFVTDWSIEKTRALQYSEHWPEIGLEFSSKIIEIFEEIEFIYSDIRRQHERNISKLRDLVNALQDLSVLKKSYNLTFTLDNYLHVSIDETALCILQRVPLDKLQNLVKNFLYPIFQEKGKTPVSAIRQYILKLILNRNSSSNWLERAVACIEHLHNEDDRLESAILVLQNSPVPWPDTVTPLIKLRSSTHPLALKINDEYEIQVIKIMKAKYGWPADSASDINLDLFMMRIVKMNLPDMLDDIRVLTKAAPEIASSVNFNCCYQMVRRGQTDAAYEFYKTLHFDSEAKNVNNIFEITAEMLENSIPALDDDKCVEEQRNLIEFLKLITPNNCAYAQQRLNEIRNRFILRSKFQLNLNSNSELISIEQRLTLLNAGIEQIIERSQATLNVTKFFVSKISELCAALKMQKTFGIHRVCVRMRCLPFSCALAYAISEFVDCVEENKNDFVNLAIELLSQQILSSRSSKRQDATSSMQLLYETDPLAFPLAYELLSSALLHERKEQRDLNELIMYVQIVSGNYPVDAIASHYKGREHEINEQICKALDAAEIVFGDATLNYSTVFNGSFDVKPTVQAKRRDSVSVFDMVDVQPHQPQVMTRVSSQLPIVKFVARTLRLMIVEGTPTNCLLLKLRAALPSEVIEDMEAAREEFFLSLEQLIKLKAHDIWYIMAQYLLEYQKYNKCNRIINSDFVSLQLSRFFRNAMTQKDVNFIELFVMLIADSHAPSLLEKLTNDVKTDQQKINLLTLSEIYNNHLGEIETVEAIRAKRIKHYYYMEFCLQDPSIKGKFNADIDNVEQLLKEFHNKKLDVHLLERMSRDFGFDYQKMLITHILSILSAQELNYDIKIDAFGDEELVMLSTVKDMRDMCQPYIAEIKNIDLLTSKLKQFIEEINIYFYELYLCVIEILLFFDAVPKELQIWTNILQFLKHKMIFRRCNRPGQLETDMWLQSQKEIGVLPKIARYRLPFKPIVEHPLKDILDSELSVDNCQSWFPLIQMHTVLKGSKEIAQNCDYFCMSAVKNSIAEYKAKNVKETWHLNPTNNTFLKSILRLVEHVHNKCKAFLILYFVSNYAPDGADQVEAAYECWKYALENETSINDPKCQEQLMKIKRKYPILKTQHLLHVYGLADEKLMRSIENPTQLIHGLYHHELILKASKLDINAVVTEIAKLHNLDVRVIQYALLQKWLSVTMDTNDGTVLEETFSEDPNLLDNITEDSDNATENVIRANYILNSWQQEDAVKFLIAYLFSADGAVNTSKQLQMYECFSKLNDGTSFDNMFTQEQYIAIKCVHELKTLGYNSSIEKLADKNCNKIDILKTLWQRNAQNPHALEIMANICLGFNIFLPKIWNGILKRMVIFNMVRELNALVDVLSCKPQLLHTDGLALAWDCVLLHPLKNATHARSFAQEEQLHKTLFRLQSCPVAHALNLYQIAEQCVLIDRLHMAAVVITFSKNFEDRQTIKKLILKRKTNNLRKEILDLEESGIIPVILSYALKELEL